MRTNSTKPDIEDRTHDNINIDVYSKRWLYFWGAMRQHSGRQRLHLPQITGDTIATSVAALQRQS